MKYLLAILVLYTSCISFSNSAVINYDEKVDGDLSDSFFSFDASNSNYLGNLDIGLNTISGSSFYQDTPRVSDDDYFHFSIQDGQQLISMSVFNSVTEQANFIYATNDATLWGVNIGFITWLSAEIFWLDGNPFELGQPDRNLFPNPNTEIFSPRLTAGDYTVFALGPSGAFYDNASIAWDYTFTFEVSPIPLPATAWLFLSGLGLLSFKTKQHN